MDYLLYWRTRTPERKRVLELITDTFDGLATIEEQPSGWWVVRLPDRTKTVDGGYHERWIDVYSLMTDREAPHGGMVVGTRTNDRSHRREIRCDDRAANALAKLLFERLQHSLDGMPGKPLAGRDVDGQEDDDL